MAVVRGRPFAGFLTRRRGVLHIAPEGARSSRMPPSCISVPGRRTTPNPTSSCRFASISGTAHVATAIELVNALEQVHGCDIGLIIIDTLVLSVDDADENASRDMMAAIFGATRLAEGSEAHVTLIHHTNKSGDVRGSSVITCNPDAVFEIASAKDEQDRPIMQMTTRKQKSGKKAPRSSSGSAPNHRQAQRRRCADHGGDRYPAAGTKIGIPGKHPKASPGERWAARGGPRCPLTLADDPAAPDAGFEPGMVRDACDRAAFSGCADNPGSFLKAVSRALEALAGEPVPAIVKDGGRYRLVTTRLRRAFSASLTSSTFGIAAE